MRRALRSTLFPYTTLFRSQGDQSHADSRRLPVPPRRGRLLPQLRVHAGTECLLLGLQRRRETRRRLERRIVLDRKSTRLNSSHVEISYAVFCLKKKNTADI